MGSRIVIVRWCDNHDGSQDYPGEERTFLDRNGKPKLGDICTPESLATVPGTATSCIETMTLSVLYDFLDEHGRNPEKVQAGRGPIKPGSPEHNAMVVAATGSRKGRPPKDGDRPHICLWCACTYAASSGWSKHVEDLHGLKGVMEALGDVCPVCGQPDLQVLSGHAVRAHKDLGIRTASGLFIYARDHGDEFGLYEQRRKLGQNVQEVAA